ncbi:MAG: heavy metal-responsive transcriptional regulator [Planctomycetota bacterium]|nr:MAG: heavy metal-responsive transcriptional regulator [Planctomycetota bacterium]
MIRNGTKAGWKTIGEAAAEAGVSASTLRYYEREGLLAPTGRSGAGYRLYDEEAIRRLRFIRSAQAVGFTLEDIRALLELDGQAPCTAVREILQRRLKQVEDKLADLERVRDTLAEALERCRSSNERCAVLADLNRGESDGRG